MNKSDESSRDSGALSNPLSFLRSGDFGWDGASLNNRGNVGYFWSLRSRNTIQSNDLGFLSTNLSTQDYNYRGRGFAVRCVRILSKSFTTLINTSYSMKDNKQTEEDNRDSGLLSNPLSFIRSGCFYWRGADLNYRGNDGLYWFLRSSDTSYSNVLNFNSTSLNPHNSSVRGHGFAVRCELRKPLQTA